VLGGGKGVGRNVIKTPCGETTLRKGVTSSSLTVVVEEYEKTKKEWGARRDVGLSRAQGESKRSEGGT